MSAIKSKDSNQMPGTLKYHIWQRIEKKKSWTTWMLKCNIFPLKLTKDKKLGDIAAIMAACIHDLRPLSPTFTLAMWLALANGAWASWQKWRLKAHDGACPFWLPLDNLILSIWEWTWASSVETCSCCCRHPSICRHQPLTMWMTSFRSTSSPNPVAWMGPTWQHEWTQASPTEELAKWAQSKRSTDRIMV